MGGSYRRRGGTGGGRPEGSKKPVVGRDDRGEPALVARLQKNLQLHVASSQAGFRLQPGEEDRKSPSAPLALRFVPKLRRRRWRVVRRCWRKGPRRRSIRGWCWRLRCARWRSLLYCRRALHGAGEDSADAGGRSGVTREHSGATVEDSGLADDSPASAENAPAAPEPALLSADNSPASAERAPGAWSRLHRR